MLLRGAHKLLYKHSQFLITGELGNIWFGRNGAGRNHGEGCKHSCFFFCYFLLLCRFVEWVASKDSGISCLPNKGITYVATAQHFRHIHFGTIVQQHLSHLCDASKTFHMLRHINSATNKNRTQVQLWSIDSVHSQTFHVNSTELPAHVLKVQDYGSNVLSTNCQFMEPF